MLGVVGQLVDARSRWAASEHNAEHSGKEGRSKKVLAKSQRAGQGGAASIFFFSSRPKCFHLLSLPWLHSWWTRGCKRMTGEHEAMVVWLVGWQKYEGVVVRLVVVRWVNARLMGARCDCLVGGRVSVVL